MKSNLFESWLRNTWPENIDTGLCTLEKKGGL